MGGVIRRCEGRTKLGFKCRQKIENWRLRCENGHPNASAIARAPDPEYHGRQVISSSEVDELFRPRDPSASQWDRFRADHQSVSFDDGFDAALDWGLLDALDDSWVVGMLRSGEERGELDDRDLAQLVFHQLIAPARPGRAECPASDCVEVVGRVVVIKDPDEELVGESWKMLVQQETDGGVFRVWGRIPSGVAEVLAHRGRRLVRRREHMDIRGLGLTLRLVARVAPSELDPSFGYFNRVRKLELVLDGAEIAEPVVMPIEDAKTLKPGDLINRWWEIGDSRPRPPLKVVSVNQKTVTVVGENGRRWRVPFAELANV